MIAIRAAAISFVGLLLTFAASGQDVVEIKTGEGSTRIEGELVQYDDRGIAIRAKNNRVLRYEASRVKSVTTKFTPEQERGDECLARGDYVRAVEHLERALTLEKRPWAVIRIRSALVKALRGQGALARAGELFLELLGDQNEPEWMVMAPLLWRRPDKISDETIQKARRWLPKREQPVAVLLAASWLLETNDKEPALQALTLLETSNDARGLSELARAQRWRLADEFSKPEDLQRFRLQIAKLPPTLRSGPQFVLGQAYDRIGKPADAALAYLWVPFVYGADGDLAPRCLLHAAESSARAGFTEDAMALFKEVVEKYPGTSFATQASAKLPSAKPASSSTVPKVQP